MMKTRFPELGHFFSCYFHQDWMLEYSNWQVAARDFLERESPEVSRAATTQLGQLLSMDLDEEALDAAVFELGNMRDPAPQSYGTWLAELHWYLRRSIRP